MTMKYCGRVNVLKIIYDPLQYNFIVRTSIPKIDFILLKNFIERIVRTVSSKNHLKKPKYFYTKKKSEDITEKIMIYIFELLVDLLFFMKADLIKSHSN